jgi:hypothetical protein
MHRGAIGCIQREMTLGVGSSLGGKLHPKAH